MSVFEWPIDKTLFCTLGVVDQSLVIIVLAKVDNNALGSCYRAKRLAREKEPLRTCYYAGLAQ